MKYARLTVFTPTFNRSYILKNCYDSLCRQTNKGFVWLIVDDGSTDNTEQLVSTWRKENKVDITYIKQQNAGKHVAHNTGVLNCKTDIFVCVDSDDSLTDDAVEVIYQNWQAIDDDLSLAGLIALRGYPNGRVNGTRMPHGINRCRMLDLYNKYGFKGDTIIVLKTNVLKKNLFPVFEGEKFVTEAVVYDKIDQDHQFLLLDRILYISEYLEDGYTRNILKVHRSNPKGYIYFLTERVGLSHTLTERYKAVAYYLAGCWTVKYKHPIKNSNHKLLCLLALPKAIVIFLKPGIKSLLIKILKNE